MTKVLCWQCGEDLCGKRPVLNHHGVAEATIGNGIGGILLPLAALIPNGGNDHHPTGTERSEGGISTFLGSGREGGNGVGLRD